MRVCRRNNVAGASFLSTFKWTVGLQSIVELHFCQGVSCIVYNGIKVSSPYFCVLLNTIVARIVYRWICFGHCLLQRVSWACCCPALNIGER